MGRGPVCTVLCQQIYTETEMSIVPKQQPDCSSLGTVPEGVPTSLTLKPDVNPTSNNATDTAARRVRLSTRYNHPRVGLNLPGGRGRPFGGTTGTHT